MDYGRFRCCHCKKLRRKQTLDQRYCGERRCQKARKNTWRREKYAQDSDYRANQRDSTNAWLDEHGGSASYHRAYRKRLKSRVTPEAAAFKRITAARAGRKFPEVLAAVRDGDLHVTAVGLLAPHFTEESLAELIALGRHQTKDEILRRLADRHPKGDISSVRRRAGPNQQHPLTPQTPTTEETPVSPPPVSIFTSPPPPKPAPKPEPLGGDRYCIRFTASPEVHRQIQELTALLRHQIPDGDLAKILALAVDGLHKQVRKQKFGECGRPRMAAQESNGIPSRQIPAAIRRAVSKRDGERCTYVSPTGRRCTSREFLEFHHLTPWARRRVHDVEGISLRCRAHNQYEAERDFGVDHMAQFRKAGDGKALPTRSGASRLLQLP